MSIEYTSPNYRKWIWHRLKTLERSESNRIDAVVKPDPWSVAYFYLIRSDTARGVADIRNFGEAVIKEELL